MVVTSKLYLQESLNQTKPTSSLSYHLQIWPFGTSTDRSFREEEPTPIRRTKTLLTSLLFAKYSLSPFKMKYRLLQVFSHAPTHYATCKLKSPFCKITSKLWMRKIYVNKYLRHIFLIEWDFLEWRKSCDY